MELTKDKAIELMKGVGYTYTASSFKNEYKKRMVKEVGKEEETEIYEKENYESELFFTKTVDEVVSIKAVLNIRREKFYLEVIGVFEGGVRTCSTPFPFQIKNGKFEKIEQALIKYTYLCLNKPTEPKEEKKTIEERKREFWDKIREKCKEKGYSKELALEFYDYWTATNEGGKKFRKEMEKVFDIPGRLRTWIKHDKKWSKTFIDKKVEKQEKELREVNKIVSKKELFG